MSMSIPLLINPCKEFGVHHTHHQLDEQVPPERHALRQSLLQTVQAKRGEIHAQSRLGLDVPPAPELQKTASQADSGGSADKSPRWSLSDPWGLRGGRKSTADDEAAAAAAAADASKRAAEAQKLEYYVDGGVLLNYPIEAFDGW